MDNKFKPYNSVGEMIASQSAQLARNGIIWLKSQDENKRVMVTGYNYEYNEVQIEGEWCSLEYIFSHYLYDDSGLPVGDYLG